MTLQDILQKIREQYGFLTMEDRDNMLKVMSRFDGQVLVRCGAGRFLCGLRELPEQIAKVEADGDYVRDVSIPAAPKPVDWLSIGYSAPFRA